jgi:hypothetical protein
MDYFNFARNQVDYRSNTDTGQVLLANDDGTYEVNMRTLSYGVLSRVKGPPNIPVGTTVPILWEDGDHNRPRILVLDDDAESDNRRTVGGAVSSPTDDWFWPDADEGLSFSNSITSGITGEPDTWRSGFVVDLAGQVTRDGIATSWQWSGNAYSNDFDFDSTDPVFVGDFVVTGIVKTGAASGIFTAFPGLTNNNMYQTDSVAFGIAYHEGGGGVVSIADADNIKNPLWSMEFTYPGNVSVNLPGSYFVPVLIDVEIFNESWAVGTGNFNFQVPLATVPDLFVGQVNMALAYPAGAAALPPYSKPSWLDVCECSGNPGTILFQVYKVGQKTSTPFQQVVFNAATQYYADFDPTNPSAMVGEFGFISAPYEVVFFNQLLLYPPLNETDFNPIVFPPSVVTIPNNGGQPLGGTNLAMSGTKIGWASLYSDIVNFSFNIPQDPFPRYIGAFPLLGIQYTMQFNTFDVDTAVLTSNVFFLANFLGGGGAQPGPAQVIGVSDGWLLLYHFVANSNATPFVEYNLISIPPGEYSPVLPGVPTQVQMSSVIQKVNQDGSLSWHTSVVGPMVSSTTSDNHYPVTRLLAASDDYFAVVLRTDPTPTYSVGIFDSSSGEPVGTINLTTLGYRTALGVGIIAIITADQVIVEFPVGSVEGIIGWDIATQQIVWTTTSSGTGVMNMAQGGYLYLGGKTRLK